MAAMVSARGGVLPATSRGLQASAAGHSAHPVACEPPSSASFLVNGCFGWLHTPPAVTRDTAVLLCPALGWDGLHAHHGLRLLADQIAAAGYPALRIQYPGTADSRDLAVAEEPWSAWLQSVHAAADWARAETGTSRLVFIGLRIGAALAAVAAQSRADVDGLVLLAPVLRGKSYIRQLDMEARLEGGDAARPELASGLEFHELRFGAATVGRIGDVDLRTVRLPSPTRIALALQAASQLAERCTEAWNTAGHHVAALPFAGLEPLLQNPTHADPSVPDFSGLLAWITAAVPSATVPRAAPAVAQPLLSGPGYTEAPVLFGSASRLFGIHCRPAVRGGHLAVVIANTGRDPHYGIGRFGVELARRLAAAGIASLRMDFAGLGDSPAPAGDGDALTSLFEMDRSADLAAAIDTLHSLGYREFAVQGLCSGGYHALHAAGRDARVGALLLVNLPTFQWQGGDSVKAALWKAAPASRILERLVDRTAWLRALQGQSGLAAIVQAQSGRLWDRARRLLGRPAPHVASPRQVIGALEARHVRCLFLYAAGDPGIDTLEDAWGRNGEGLATRPGIDLRIVPEINHVLSGAPMRARVIDHLVSFLTDKEVDRRSDSRSTERDNSYDYPPTNDNGRQPAASTPGAAAR